MEQEKQQALGMALSQIEKQFGQGSIMRMGDVDVAMDVDAVPSGSLALDIAPDGCQESAEHPFGVWRVGLC